MNYKLTPAQQRVVDQMEPGEWYEHTDIPYFNYRAINNLVKAGVLEEEFNKMSDEYYIKLTEQYCKDKGLV